MVQINFEAVAGGRGPEPPRRGDAGFDVFARLGDGVERNGRLVPYGDADPAGLRLRIERGEVWKIPLGFRLQLPEGWCVDVRGRSGLAKRGVQVSLGLVDEGYRGELAAIVRVVTPEEYVVSQGEKIAQIVFRRVDLVQLAEAPVPVDTERGADGFGSTGRGPAESSESIEEQRLRLLGVQGLDPRRNHNTAKFFCPVCLLNGRSRKKARNAQMQLSSGYWWCYSCSARGAADELFAGPIEELDPSEYCEPWPSGDAVCKNCLGIQPETCFGCDSEVEASLEDDEARDHPRLRELLRAPLIGEAISSKLARDEWLAACKAWRADDLDQPPAAPLAALRAWVGIHTHLPQEAMFALLREIERARARVEELDSQLNQIRELTNIT